MQRISGFSEAGNTTLVITGAAGTITRKVQGSFPLATITVFLAGTVTLASIYSDDLTPPTAKANPFTADASGIWFFYAPNGRYDIRFSGGGISVPFTLGDFLLTDESPFWIDPTDPIYAGGMFGPNPAAALQAAVESITPGSGALILIPAGTFTMTSAIGGVGGVDRRVELRGAGQGATILHWSVTGVDGINPDDDWIIRDMTLRGPDIPAPLAGYIGIDMGAAGGSQRVIIEDVLIEAWGTHGVNSGGTSSDCYLKNVVSRNNHGEGYLVTGNSHRWTFDNCQAYGNRYNGWDVAGLGHRFVCPIGHDNGGDTTVASSGDQDGILIVCDGGTPITDDIEVLGGSFYNNNTHGIRIQNATPGTTISNVRIIGVRSTGNGTGDGGSNPSLRFGDGIIALSNGGLTAVVKDCKFVGCHIEANYRFGIGVISEIHLGTYGPVERTQIMACAALSQTGWSGTGGPNGIVLFGAGVIDTLITSCHSLLNTNNYLDGGGTVRTVVHGLVQDASGSMLILPSIAVGTSPGLTAAIGVNAFGNLTVSPRLSIGANAATTGILGTPDGQFWYAKDSGGTDRLLIGMLGGQTVIRGGGAAAGIAVQTMAGFTTFTVDEATASTNMDRRFNRRQGGIFPDGDTTPSVINANLFSVANTAPTAISFFDDGAPSQEIVVSFFDNVTTLVASATLRLKGDVNFKPVGFDAISLFLSGGIWFEVSRRSNEFDWTQAANFADGDTTPSVRGGNFFGVFNSAPTSITDFDDGSPGQEFTLVFSDNNTTLVVGAALHLAGGVNFVATTNDTITLIHSGAVWYEKSRSVN